MISLKQGEMTHMFAIIVHDSYSLVDFLFVAQVQGLADLGWAVWHLFPGWLNQPPWKQPLFREGLADLDYQVVWHLGGRAWQ